MKGKTKKILAIVFFGIMITAWAYFTYFLGMALWYLVLDTFSPWTIVPVIACTVIGIVFMVLWLTYKRKKRIF